MDARVDRGVHARARDRRARPWTWSSSAATPAAAGEARHFSIGPSSRFATRTGTSTGVGAVILDITARQRAPRRERKHAHALEQEARAAAEEAAAARTLPRRGERDPRRVARLRGHAGHASRAWRCRGSPTGARSTWSDPDGSLRRVTTAHVDPEKIELAEEWTRRYPTDPDAPTGASERAAHRARPRSYPEITDEMIVAGGARRRAPRPDPLARHARRDGRADDRPRPHARRDHASSPPRPAARYGDDDLLLAEELARRAATSIDNARLYSERSYIAQTLQHSLLPPHAARDPRARAGRALPPGGRGQRRGRRLLRRLRDRRPGAGRS